MPKTAKKRRKKKGKGETPVTGGAGLIRFFEDETPGIKVGPTLVVVFAAVLLIVVIIAHLNILSF